MTTTDSEVEQQTGQAVAWLSGADFLRLAVQTLTFFVLAATLGAEGFGRFAGTAALIAILQPLASWGASDLLLKHVAIDRESISRWLGTTVAVTSTTVIALSVLLLFVIGPIVLGDAFDRRLMVPLIVSELITMRIVEISFAAFLAMDHIAGASLARLGWAVTRFLALISFALVADTPTAIGWATVQAVALGALCVFMMAQLRSRLGAFRFDRPFRHMPFGEGLAFAVGATSETVYGDIDKALLVRERGGAVAGEYTAAYRLMSFAFVPISALVMSRLTSMYRAGHTGVTDSLAVLRRYFVPVLLYLLAVAVGMVLVGPVLPSIIGDDFEDMAIITAWLALLPLIQASHRILGSVLMTGGLVRSRSVALAATAGTNALLSLYLIRRFSWQGAAAASYASEIMLVLVFATLVARAYRSELADKANEGTR